jgi:hypothetical protein
MLGEEDGAWGWPSPWSPARKRWRWWRSSPETCSGDPPTNSGKGVVDLMGKMSFSSMVELEKKKERGSFWCA